MWGSIIWRGWRKKVVIICYGSVLFYDFVGSQVIPQYNIPTLRDVLPNWDWQTWLIIGLALLLIITLEGVYRLQVIKASDNWITDYEIKNCKLPPIPDYLHPIVPTYKKGEPITRDIQVINMSGQFWSNLSPSQKQELRQMLEWLGTDPDDYIWQMQRMLPKTPPMKPKWTPPEQK